MPHESLPLRHVCVRVLYQPVQAITAGTESRILRGRGGGLGLGFGFGLGFGLGFGFGLGSGSGFVLGWVSVTIKVGVKLGRGNDWGQGQHWGLASGFQMCLSSAQSII